MTIAALSKDDHAGADHPRWRDHLRSVGNTAHRRRGPRRRRGGPCAPLPARSVRWSCGARVVMAGYWNAPDATAETVRDGWLHTGDVGSFDADGYLTLRDRSKDLIISGGMNIYPPRGRRDASYGIPASVPSPWSCDRPDPDWGRDRRRLRRRRRSSAVRRGAEPDLPRPHRPVQATPGSTDSSSPCRPTNYGKVVKRELREQLRAGAERDVAGG